MRSVWALASIVLPALGAVALGRALWHLQERSIAVLVGLVSFASASLFSVHVVAALDLLGVIDVFSLQWVAVAGLFLFAAMVLGSARIARGPCAAPTRAEPERPPLPRFLCWASGIVGLSYLLFLLDLLASYPIGWDGLQYHLPLAVRWLQDGSLAMPLSRTWRFSMPANAEIGMMLGLASGWQAAAPVMNLIAAVALVLAVYVVARRCGATVAAAHAAALVAASVPMVQFQAVRVYVDLYATAFLMAGIALALTAFGAARAECRPERVTSVLLAVAGLGGGIAFGTKPVFFTYGAVFFAAVSIGITLQRAWGARRKLMRLGVFAGGFAVPCVFWLLRALAETGNPFYPIGVHWLGRELLPGLDPSRLDGTTITSPEHQLDFVRNTAEWLVYPWLEFKRAGYPYSESSGVGAAFATFVPLGLLFAAATAFRRGARVETALRITLVSALGCAVLWWFLLARVPRFGLVGLALACAATSVLFETWLVQRTRGFRVLFVCVLSLTVIVSSREPLHAWWGRLATGDWSRERLYTIPSFLNELPDGTRVLNLGGVSPWNFAIAGKNLGVRVISTFEAPPELTPAYLAEQKVDFIAWQGEGWQATLAPVAESVYEISDGRLELHELEAPSWHVWGVR